MNRPDAIDYEVLAHSLRALAYPARLELLEILRYPKRVPEIRLTARRDLEEGAPAPPASRQTVAGHLAKLVDAKLVDEIREEGQGRPVVQYQANAHGLFETLDAIRRLSVRTHTPDNKAESTLTLTGPAPASTAKGPRLVVARGIEEGRVYELTKPARGEGGWIVGRRAGHAVRMDFDRYVSSENSRIEKTGRGKFTIRDLGSKNGTRVNWAPLQEGEGHSLSPGDIVGVGRSLLVFADR